MTKHVELAGEVVINAHNLFLQTGRNAGTTPECTKAIATAEIGKSGAGEDSGAKKSRSIWVNHATRDHVPREWLSRNNGRGARVDAARAISEQIRGRDA